MPSEDRKHKQSSAHPFRRHIPTRKAIDDDEWFEINHGSFIANKQGNPRGSGGGHGR
jgi:hypothetical protein